MGTELNFREDSLPSGNEIFIMDGMNRDGNGLMKRDDWRGAYRVHSFTHFCV